MKGSVKKLSKSERKQVVVVLFYNTFNTNSFNSTFNNITRQLVNLAH